MKIFAFAVWRHLHRIQNYNFINSWNLIKTPQKFIQCSFFIKLTKIWQLIGPEVFCKKSVVKDFAKFTKKHLCQSLLFNKVAGLRPLLKKRLWNMRFSVNFAKFYRTLFFIEHLWWFLCFASVMEFCHKPVWF